MVCLIRITVKDDLNPTGTFLITGAHRLAAAKKLGWLTIPCFVEQLGFTEIEAELYEIAENLHRSDLTALERNTQTDRWIELTKLPQPGAVSKGGRGNEGGVRAAIRELGISKGAADRAQKIGKLSPEAKAAAVEVGIDDNQRALLRAASSAEPVKEIRKIADEKANPVPKAEMVPWKSPSPNVDAGVEPQRKYRDDVVMLDAALIYARNGEMKLVNSAIVKELAADIKEIGLFNPIDVTPGKTYLNGQWVDGWHILGGHHRFKAMSTILHMQKIPCFIYDLRRQKPIVENEA